MTTGYCTRWNFIEERKCWLAIGFHCQRWEATVDMGQKRGQTRETILRKEAGSRRGQVRLPSPWSTFAVEELKGNHIMSGCSPKKSMAIEASMLERGLETNQTSMYMKVSQGPATVV
jgi:hypothetical protein